jgi:enamine deaminase RidA (YjgF/YER057c/UK114 family)
VLENLKKTVNAAGGEITDVIQALCFFTNAGHVWVLNEQR